MMRTLLAGLLLLFLWAPTAEANPKPTPVINFGTPSPSIPSTSAITTTLSTVVMTMSNGTSFTGTLTLTANASNLCALSGTTLRTGKAPPLTAGSFTCTIKATQSGQSVSKSITIKVTAATLPTPIIQFGNTAPTIYDTTKVGTPLSTIGVTMSDGSTFNGTLAFGFPNNNGSPLAGVCAISGTNPNANLILGIPVSGSSSTNCTVTATQGGQTTSANITITVNAVIPSITFAPASPAAIQNTTQPPYTLSAINVTMSDGSVFAGTLTFGGTYGNGGGACALSGVGTTLVAPTTNTLVDSQGTWSFASNFVSGFGYPILLNGNGNIGAGSLLLSYNGNTYAQIVTGAWYIWNGAGFVSILGDPRPAASLTLGKNLTTVGSPYNCSVVATQGSDSSAPVNFQIVVTGSATPTVTLAPSTQSEFDNATVNTPLSTIGVSMSDSSTFTGSLGFGGTYGNDSGICSLSSMSLPANVTLGKPFSAGASTQHCSIVATQGVTASAPVDLTITVAGPTPTVTFGTNPVAIQSTTAIGTSISGITVAMSDGSTFNGTLSLTNSAGNVCALPATGVLLTAPTTTTITAADGAVWSFGPFVISSYGFGIYRNGVQPTSGAAGLLLLLFNGQIYNQNAVAGNQWYLWNGSGYTAVADPRPPGSGTITIGKALTAGSYTCTLTATEGSASSSANLTVNVTAAATPTVTLGSPTVTIPNTTQPPFPLSTIAVAMSDSSTFTGTLQLAGTYGNGNGACALSSAMLPATVNLGQALTTAGSPYNCTVVATQPGVAPSSANIAITVTGLSLTITFGTPTPMIPDSTAVGSLLSSISVSVSDGSTFNGTIGFGGNDSSMGNYGNDTGVCELSATLLPGGSGTLTNSQGVWSFGTATNQYGTIVLLNGVNAGTPIAGSYATTQLLYNGQIYNQNAVQGNNWFLWTGSGYQAAADPRPSGSGPYAVDLGSMLSGASTQNCTITATQ